MRSCWGEIGENESNHLRCFKLYVKCMPVLTRDNDKDVEMLESASNKLSPHKIPKKPNIISLELGTLETEETSGHLLYQTWNP